MFARGLQVCWLCTISRPFAPLISFQFKSWNPTRDKTVTKGTKEDKESQHGHLEPWGSHGYCSSVLWLSSVAWMSQSECEPRHYGSPPLWLSSIMALLHGLNEPVSAVKVNPSRTRHSSIGSTARLTVFHIWTLIILYVAPRAPVVTLMPLYDARS